MLILVIVIAFVVLFYKVADMESLEQPWLWGLSSGIFGFLGGAALGFCGMLSAEGGMLLLLGLFIHIQRNGGPYTIWQPVKLLRHLRHCCPECGLDLRSAGYDTHCPACNTRIEE